MFIPVDEARIFSVSFGPKTAPAIVGIGGWIGSGKPCPAQSVGIYPRPEV